MPTRDISQISGYVEGLKAGLQGLTRREIERIGELGEIHWGQLYAFRRLEPTARIGDNVTLDTLLRIERGLQKFQKEKADQAAPLDNAPDCTAEHAKPHPQTHSPRIRPDRVAGPRTGGTQ